MKYLKEMRQRLGLAKDDSSHDGEIQVMDPMERVRLIAGWFLGDGQWADIFKDYFESQGFSVKEVPATHEIEEFYQETQES
jgi:hypothetical protein